MTHKHCTLQMYCRKTSYKNHIRWPSVSTENIMLRNRFASYIIFPAAKIPTPNNKGYNAKQLIGTPRCAGSLRGIGHRYTDTVSPHLKQACSNELGDKLPSYGTDSRQSLDQSPGTLSLSSSEQPTTFKHSNVYSNALFRPS